MSDRKPSQQGDGKAAGGWGAAAATARVLIEQSVVGKGSRALLEMNQPGGFKCPSCAFPDSARKKKLDFCENGVKALAHEATKHRVDRDFFARHSVAELAGQSDYWLEMQGRLTEPMRYDAETDHYVPVAWEDAYALIGRHLQALDHPDQAEFYTSGRTPNEAAFLFSIFGREFGTNNFPDCANMCHEPTSRGLPPSIGIGKGTVVMEDFEHTEAIFIFGQNTGTNSPRMMGNLVEARKRGVPVVAVNPMPERALMRFTDPQDPRQMATFRATDIASEFVHVKIGGDLALLKGMMRALFEADDKGRAVLDRDFIAAHCAGFGALRDEIMSLDWAEIADASGIAEDQIRRCAEIYAGSGATMICYGMGLTQHQNSAELLQQVANLLLLRGNFGKPGAGIVPIRGHSNVQGDRTVGIDEKPTDAYLDRVEQVFGFVPPRDHGHHVLDALYAMEAGQARVFIGMGGNFIRAVPDRDRAEAAMRRLDLTVGIATKLNRGHLVHGRDALILPVIARSEIIRTAQGVQFVTIEDAMANVTASHGVLEPATGSLRSEVEIVCRMAAAALPGSTVPWLDFIGDYDLIRDRIAATYPDLFTDFNAKIRQEGGFHLDVPPRRRVWKTPNGKANFLVMPGLDMDDPVDAPDMLRLATIRSHDQFNTTIYSCNDRYRGIRGDREVLFMNAGDMAARGIETGSAVEVTTISDDTRLRRVTGLRAQEYPLPRGSAAGYFPELNPLLPFDHHDRMTGTPAAKSIPVRVVAAGPRPA
ncbi:formate dehydrogenase major subunit [Paracoccus isoporae]|uniref:Formate dehydrogenase major subunit n=1 Tax=Paracoccus isoporae TaxID=591205 RepID=A0A1G6XS41_9RHOB|nr:FdhF/YdeP family oxidoreductase [Paracoccus isoporae]SDD80255.1 formate dehydrogenase major subunit [Paracoccus isoporae]